jgi:hypothetical protein
MNYCRRWIGCPAESSYPAAAWVNPKVDSPPDHREHLRKIALRIRRGCGSLHGIFSANAVQEVGKNPLVELRLLKVHA